MHTHQSTSTPGRHALLIACVIGLPFALWFGYAHRDHLASWLPLAFVLACPLLHVFGHRHGGHRSDPSGPAE